MLNVTDCPAQTVVTVGVNEATGAAVGGTAVRLMLSTNNRFPLPERFLNATITLEFPTKGLKFTVSVLHCAVVGVKLAVVAGAVAKTVFDLEYTEVNVAPQSVDTSTSNPSKRVVLNGA